MTTQSPRQPAELGYLYEVTLKVLVELTTPPSHPDLHEHACENAVEYLQIQLECGLPKEAAKLAVHKVRLVEEREL